MHHYVSIPVKMYDRFALSSSSASSSSSSYFFLFYLLFFFLFLLLLLPLLPSHLLPHIGRILLYMVSQNQTPGISYRYPPLSPSRVSQHTRTRRKGWAPGVEERSPRYAE